VRPFFSFQNKRKRKKQNKKKPIKKKNRQKQEEKPKNRSLKLNDVRGSKKKLFKSSKDLKYNEKEQKGYVQILLI